MWHFVDISMNLDHFVLYICVFIFFYFNIIGTIFFLQLCRMFFSFSFYREQLSIASNRIFFSKRISNLEKLHMQKEHFLPYIFPATFIGLVWTGRTVVHPNKETRHSTLHVHRYIFHFPFLFSSFFSPFTTTSASSSSQSYLLSLFFPLSFPRHSTTDEEAAELKRTIASKRVFVRHSNSSANIYIYMSVFLSFSWRSFNESTSLSRDHIVRELSSTNRGKSEEGGACSFVRLFSNYRGEWIVMDTCPSSIIRVSIHNETR